jgi:hypothetical protein
MSVPPNPTAERQEVETFEEFERKHLPPRSRQDITDKLDKKIAAALQVIDEANESIDEARKAKRILETGDAVAHMMEVYSAPEWWCKYMLGEPDWRECLKATAEAKKEARANKTPSPTFNLNIWVSITSLRSEASYSPISQGDEPIEAEPLGDLPFLTEAEPTTNPDPDFLDSCSEFSDEIPYDPRLDTRLPKLSITISELIKVAGILSSQVATAGLYGCNTVKEGERETFPKVTVDAKCLMKVLTTVDEITRYPDFPF